VLLFGKPAEAQPGFEELGEVERIPGSVAEIMADGVFEWTIFGGSVSIDDLPPFDCGVGVPCFAAGVCSRGEADLISTEGDLEVDVRCGCSCESLTFVLGAAPRDDVLEPAISEVREALATVWLFRWKEYCWLRTRASGMRASSGEKPAMLTLSSCMMVRWGG